MCVCVCFLLFKKKKNEILKPLVIKFYLLFFAEYLKKKNSS